MRPLERRTVAKRARENTRLVKREQRKPNLPGNWIVIGTFVGLDDPGNDPEGVSYRSPPYQNGLTYSADVTHDFPAFRHGLDGGLEFNDGVFDVSGYTSGTTGFTVPAVFRPAFLMVRLIPIIDAAPTTATLTVNPTTGVAMIEF